MAAGHSMKGKPGPASVLPADPDAGSGLRPRSILSDGKPVRQSAQLFHKGFQFPGKRRIVQI